MAAMKMIWNRYRPLGGCSTIWRIIALGFPRGQRAPTCPTASRSVSSAG
jgi:hypothetical protein